MKKTNCYYFAYYVDNQPIKLLLRNENYSDVGIMYELIFENEYDFLIKTAKTIYNRDTKLNIIDLGGNIGLFSIYMIMNYPKSNICIVEPDNEAIEHFKEIITLNNFTLPKLFNYGISDVDGHNIKLSCGPRGVENAGFITTKTDIDSPLKTISLQKIIEKEQIIFIDILKIDIEGAEEDLILGKNFDYDLAKKIKFIAIEIHDDQVDRAKIEAKLIDLDFSKIHNHRVDVFKNNKFLH